MSAGVRARISVSRACPGFFGSGPPLERSVTCVVIVTPPYCITPHTGRATCQVAVRLTNGCASFVAAVLVELLAELKMIAVEDRGIKYLVRGGPVSILHLKW